MKLLPDPIPDDYVLSTADLEALGLGHRVTLVKNRKKGPPYIKLSAHRIGYRMRDVRAWMAARTVQTAA